MEVRLRPTDEALCQVIERALRVRPATARCLVARGASSADAARSLLEPRLAAIRPPRGLAGLSSAVERIATAVVRRERIGVFGDYDVDGVTTTALLTSFLRQVGAAVVARVASREEGYGFTLHAAHFFADAACTLVITGDCGTSDAPAILQLAQHGCEVIVVDHHTVPASDEAHPARALVNPFRADSTFPFRGLASVGLAFYVAAAVRTALRDSGYFRGHAEPDVRSYLDLVALGTIADLVPLTEENRVLAALGLRQMGAAPRPGVAALLKLAGATERAMDASLIAWKIAPRLNAPGRLGAAQPALDLLLADGPQAEQAAAAIEDANTARRAAQDAVTAEALALLGDSDPGAAVVVAGEGWAPGVVGIVAAKLVERYQRPAFVLAIDPATGEARGSARTCHGVDLYRTLAESKALLGRWGGHAAAAGFALHRDQVDAFRDSLCDTVTRFAAGSGPISPETYADCEVGLSEVDERLAAELAALGPFGQAFAPPTLWLRRARVASVRRVGDGSHLKLGLSDGVQGERSAIGFGLGDRDVAIGDTVDALFAPTVSTWQGRTRVELELKQVWRSEA